MRNLNQEISEKVQKSLMTAILSRLHRLEMNSKQRKICVILFENLRNQESEKRFSELTKARKLAEENAAKAQAEKEALEARLREYEERIAPQQKTEEDPIGAEPRADQFDDAFEYAKALAEWSAEKALYERDQQEANRKLEEERQKVIKTWSEKLEKAKPNLPDFDEKIIIELMTSKKISFVFSFEVLTFLINDHTFVITYPNFVSL